MAQATADLISGRKITFRKEFAAAVGGAIIGGTAGLATELGVAVQVAIVGSAGVVGGVAERAIITGSLDKALEDPIDLAKDFATNATGHGINQVTETVVTKVAGGAVETLSSRVGKARTTARQAKVGERLEKAKIDLETRQRAASATTDTIRDAVVRQQQQKKQKQGCTSYGDCPN